MSGHGINVPVLRKALEHITAHPEEWDQGRYARCLAGTIAVQQGHEVEFIGMADKTTVGENIADVASREAGLPMFSRFGFGGAHIFDERNTLGERNTLDDLWRIASELTDGDIQVPPGLVGT